MDEHRIVIIKDDKTELGFLLKQMPQSDGSSLYEARNIDSTKYYLLKEGEFYYINIE